MHVCSSGPAFNVAEADGYAGRIRIRHHVFQGDFISSSGRITPENTVGQRRVALVRAVDGAAVLAGRVAGEGAANQHGVAVAVAHGAAPAADRVPAEDAVQQRRVAAGVLHSAVSARRVAEEGAIDQRRVAQVVRHRPAIGAGVSDERAASQRQVARDVVHRAAAAPEVLTEGAVGQRRPAGVILHAAAPLRHVSDERAVCHRGAAVLIEHSSTAVRPLPGLSAGDGETVQHGRGVGPAAGDHVVAVFASGRCGVQVFRISDFDVVTVQIPAENGVVLVDIPCTGIRHAKAGIATFQRHAVDELEGGFPVAGGCCRRVDPLRCADVDNGLGECCRDDPRLLQRFLQVGIRIHPARAGVGSRSAGVHIYG